MYCSTGGLDSWIGGQPIRAITDLSDMFALLAAIALGILTAGALVPPRRG